MIFYHHGCEEPEFRDAIIKILEISDHSYWKNKDNKYKLNLIVDDIERVVYNRLIASIKTFNLSQKEKTSMEEI